MLYLVNGRGFEEITYNFFVSRRYITLCDKVWELVEILCGRTPTKEEGEVRINGAEVLQLPCSVSVCISSGHQRQRISLSVSHSLPVLFIPIDSFTVLKIGSTNREVLLGGNTSHHFAIALLVIFFKGYCLQARHYFNRSKNRIQTTIVVIQYTNPPPTINLSLLPTIHHYLARAATYNVQLR